MSVRVITPPAPFVGLDLAKRHLRVDHADDDLLITLQIAAACATIDGPGGWLGRAIGVQQLELRRDGFDVAGWGWSGGYAWEGGWNWAAWPFARIALPYPPFVSVQSITYEDGLGADQVLTPAGWAASDEGVEPAFGLSWPSGRVAANAVRVAYTAGYPDRPPPAGAADGTAPTPTVPAPIVAAALLVVGDLYANREAVVIDAARVTVVENPTAANLLAPYRIYG